METGDLQEQLLDAWICMNALLKSSKLTVNLTYNEAVVMRLVYRQYRQAPESGVPIRYILRRTNMLKSLVNRTVDALCAKGFLTKEKGKDDRRSLYVRLVPEKLPEFLAVHESSRRISAQILEIIGEADARAFIRAGEKLSEANIAFESKEREIIP